MTKYTVQIGDDGRTSSMTKDGQQVDGSLNLEQAYSLSVTYFEAAKSNALAMKDEIEKPKLRRLGIQSFLMGFTGLEAFTNVHFLSQAKAKKCSRLEKRLAQNHGSLSKRVSELIQISMTSKPDGLDQLTDQIYELAKVRHQLIHPRLEWSILEISGNGTPIVLDGMHKNFQVEFENIEFCRKNYRLFLYVVQRIAQLQDVQDIEGFMFHWTGFYGFKEISLGT